jgi:DNA-nicking Smr family endonuclease
MSRRRTLHPEEEALWHEVARTARPLSPQAATALRQAERHPHKPKAEEGAHGPSHRATELRIAPFRIGHSAPRPASEHDIAPSLAETLSNAPLQMDAKAFGRMTRGRLIPEARIDLHGMTLAEAHPELIRFILGAQMAGRRLVLVITGKGKRGTDHGPIPQRTGALRHQVPHWLRLAPLGSAVLQVAEAHLKHGGAGAYYVYLRRTR